MPAIFPGKNCMKNESKIAGMLESHKESGLNVNDFCANEGIAGQFAEQGNQSRKLGKDWITDPETSMDYTYSYKGQKPHAVSYIEDADTQTLFTYSYDASGNNLLETNSKASSDREIVWTEDNRMAAIKARGNVSHYIYDANGIRTLKMSSSSFNISVNDVSAGTTGIDGNFTVYANPYTVVRENQCTKHFFLGSQRILTKISSNDVEDTFYEGNAKGTVGGVDYGAKQTSLEENMHLNTQKLNIGWYRNTHGEVPSAYIKHYLRSKEYGGLSGQNPWGDDGSSGGDDSDDNVVSPSFEEKQYYFHPDHLGSSNYLSDVLGEAYQHVEYLPWGETFLEERNTQTDRNTYLYTGKELDIMTGLYYYEQRYYDPNKSTFLGVDPLASLAPGWTSYRYGFNNPLRYIDPDGQREWPVNATFNGHTRRHENNFRDPRVRHNGVDINLGSENNDLGAPVYATHNGTITRIASIADGDTDAGGNRVQITSECGTVSTYYMHLDAISAGMEVGGTVSEGQQIGTLGRSGNGRSDRYNAHLHYEMRLDGEVVNPARSADNLKDPQLIINERNGMSNQTTPSRVSVSSQTDRNGTTTPSYWQQLLNQIREYFSISITINPNN